jgi:hypothetical protein
MTKEVLIKVVIPGWMKRTGPEAKAFFNQHLAPHAGFSLP